MPLAKKPDVGEDIESYCRKCKANTVHTLVAKVAKVAKRVLCKTCKAEHNYSKPKDLTAKKAAPKKKTTTRRSAASIGQKWATLVASLESSSVVDYSMKGNYDENSLIKHPVFGVGVVTKCVNSSRAEVLFETGIKLMATSRE